MISFDFSAFERKARAIEGAAKQIPFVASYALTNAMKDARVAEVQKMKDAFDRPVPFTLNSLAVVPATKTNLVAELRPKEFAGKGTPANKYLAAEINGGPRRAKRFERALQARGLLRSDEFVVPSENLKRDPYGNIPGGVINQILTALGASRDTSQNVTGRSRVRRRAVNRSYFVMRRRDGGQPGIYIRVGRFPVLVMLFVRQPTYSKRYPFYETARQVIPAAFNKHFAEGWDRFVVKEVRKA